MSRLSREKRQQIQDLLTAGCSDSEIARRAGVDRSTVGRHRKGLHLPGYRTTAENPACRDGHAFPENLRVDGNGWHYCITCRRANRRARWARSYIPVQPDEVAVERAVSGDAPERLTPRERAAAVRLLDRRGLSAAEIAERVRCSQRNVYYLRSTFRKAA